MYQLILALLLALAPALAFAQDTVAKPPPALAEKTKGMTAMPGYFPVYRDDRAGKLYLEISRWNEEFLYVNSLTGGVGSNDIGLDRNQLGQDRIVKFVRSGPRVLLLQPNQRYRAITDNAEERQAVEDAFAQSVLAGFKVEAEEGGRVLIDLTPLLMADAHGVVQRLKAARQGQYKVDADRSFIQLEETRNFPKNSEFEVLMTFVGEPQGEWVTSVTPTPEALTVRQHHSFVELPDANYRPRTYDPRSGYFNIEYADYATPISQPLAKRFIQRHRLEKRDPTAALSEPVEPIVYYLDRGVPEPIRSALLEGARWWNEAFEAAGFKDAFRVEMLPEGADPMDVRYNVINWTHRSTRGWSYGSTVTDPRTGEIIKGHVLLGSLRVRQDFLIAQGLVEAYANGDTPDPRLEEMALARLRQLSAHEVGHTLGLAHNFAASYNNRASVMDYPHPYIKLTENKQMDFSEAYDTGIGEWDKRAIIYGYAVLGEGAAEAEALNKLLLENEQQGLLYLSDPDARPAHSAHPYAHLWDNGESPIDEFNRLKAVRTQALQRFGEKNLAPGMPMSELETVLVPLYLMHRYQVDALSKWIGGINYRYAVRGDGGAKVTPVTNFRQRDALAALLTTLTPDFLAFPKRIRELIPPPAYGYNRGREHFPQYTGGAFDPLSAAEVSADHTLSLLLNPQRLARLEEQRSHDPSHLGVGEMLHELWQHTRRQVASGMQEGYRPALARVVERRLVLHLIRLASDKSVHPQVAGAALMTLNDIRNNLNSRGAPYGQPTPRNAHTTYLINEIDTFRQRPGEYQLPPAPRIPDGAPIGCEH